MYMYVLESAHEFEHLKLILLYKHKYYYTFLQFLVQTALIS